ncbi:MAG: hypothetical protein OEZ38_01900 [Gammaproteobacteria bacterium]|nr:hypothetical protein [Gammaproteobacteria bacterium]
MSSLIFDQRERIEDRRRWDVMAEFPLVDSDGMVIAEDRRKNAERRGYRLEEITADDAVYYS